MKRVTLYSMANCPHCQQVKQYLDSRQIKYRLCNIKTPAGQKEWHKLGLRSVPVLKVSDQIITRLSIKELSKLFAK